MFFFFEQTAVDILVIKCYTCSMYRLLCNGSEIEFATLDAALDYSKHLRVEWTILAPDGSVAFDWMDRVGP